MSEIIESLTRDMERLHKSGVVSAMTLREFKKLNVPKPKNYTSEDIIRIREKKIKVSQSVFAELLCVATKTVQGWEQGIKKPRGCNLKLLSIADTKGLEGLL